MFAKKHVDRMVEEVRLEKALEHQLNKWGITQASPPRLQSMLPKFKALIRTPPERSASGEKDGNNEKRCQTSDRGSRDIASHDKISSPLKSCECS